MPKVASEVKAVSHSNMRAPHRPAAPAERPDSSKPFSDLLESAAAIAEPAERPAAPAKPNRTGQAGASRASSAADRPDRPAERPEQPAAEPAAQTAPSDDIAEEPAAASPATIEAEVEVPPEAETVEAQTVADATVPAAPPPPVVAAPAAAPIQIASDSGDEDGVELTALDPSTAVAPAPETAARLPRTAPLEAAEKKSNPAGAPAPANADETGAADNQGPAVAAGQDDKPNAKHGNPHIEKSQTHAAPAQDVAAPRSGKAEHADTDFKPVQTAAPASNADSSPPLTFTAVHSASASAAASPSNQAVPVANAVPVAGLAIEIATQARSGGRRFEIRLDPPELGRIDVRLEVDRQGNVTSHLRVDRVETLDMLRRDAASLERALQDAGLKTSDNALNFSLRDQSMQQQSAHQGPRDGARYVVADDATLPDTAAQPAAWASRLGGIDIRI